MDAREDSHGMTQVRKSNRSAEEDTYCVGKKVASITSQRKRE
jgi:hypothetical protein